MRLPVGDFGSSARVAKFSLVLVALAWGATFTLTKGALRHVDPAVFIFLRFGLASLSLVVLVRVFYSGRRLSPTKTEAKWGSLLGLILWSASYTQTDGLRFVSPSVSGLLTGLSVIIVPFAARLFRRTVSPKSLVAAAIALLGSVLVAGFGRVGSDFGVELTVACAILFALQIVVTDLCASLVDLTRLVLTELSVVCLLSLLQVLGQSGALHSAMVQFSHVGNLSVGIALLFNALLGTTAAYLIQTSAQRKLSPTEVGVIVSLEPGFALVVAWLAGSVPTPLEVLGALLILVGVILASL